MPNTNNDVDEEDVANHISLPQRVTVENNISNPEAAISNDDNSTTTEEATIFSTLQAARGDSSTYLTDEDASQQGSHQIHSHDYDSEFNNQVNLENESYDSSAQDMAKDNDRLYDDDDGDPNHDEVKWKIMMESNMEIRDGALYEDDNIDDWLFVNEGENENQEQTNKEQDTNCKESDNTTYGNNVKSHDNDSNSVSRDVFVVNSEDSAFVKPSNHEIIENNNGSASVINYAAEIEIATSQNHDENQSIATNDFTTPQKAAVQVLSSPISTETSTATESHDPNDVQNGIPMITVDAPDN